MEGTTTIKHAVLTAITLLFAAVPALARAADIPPKHRDADLDRPLNAARLRQTGRIPAA